jgi:hypothetical protein
MKKMPTGKDVLIYLLERGDSKTGNVKGIFHATKWELRREVRD